MYALYSKKNQFVIFLLQLKIKSFHLFQQNRILYKTKKIMDNPYHHFHETVLGKRCLQSETYSNLLQYRLPQETLPANSRHYLQ